MRECPVISKTYRYASFDEHCVRLVPIWLGKEMIALSPPPRRTGRAGHLAPGSSNLRTPKGALRL